MTTAENTLDSVEADEVSTPPTRSKKWLTILGWSGVTLFFLIFFTLAKLPDQRIKSYLDSQIAAQLSPKGISFSSKSGSISLLFGLTYTMKDISLNLPPPLPSGYIDRMDISPSLIPMLWGKTGGSFSIQNKDGFIQGNFSVSSSQKGDFVKLSYQAKNLDLGRMGVLPILAGIQGSGTLSGEGRFAGDLNAPNTWDGTIGLNLSKFVLDSQSIMGFSVPRVGISDSVAEITFDQGKGKVKSLRLGKPGNSADDIHATLSGDLVLGKRMDASTMNLKTNLSLSETVTKAFILVDALLGPYKQADGSYTFMLSGPLDSPMPGPVAP